MENPLQILRDALELRGLTFDEIILVAAGLEHPLAILDMTDWVVDHPEATWQELINESTRLIEKYLLSESPQEK